MNIGFIKALLLIILFANITPGISLKAQVIVPLQTRDSSNEKKITRTKKDASKIGIVVIDMWNWHWCKTAAARVACMVPRMNKSLEEARKLGMQVFWCPTDVADNYVGTPQREVAMGVKKVPLPPSLNIECPHPGGGGCMCGKDKCLGNYGWDAMAGELNIKNSDIVSSGPEELYALCKERGITDLWYMGVHTNNCVLGKPEGMRNMMNYGFNCVLVRDLQDPETFYDPEKGITPDDNNAKVVRHFEKYLAPSVDFVSFLSENKLWKSEWIVDPVRITPWGKPERPHQFRDKEVITLTSPHDPQAQIRYTLDGKEPDKNSKIYTGPITITSTTTIKSKAFKNGKAVTTGSTGYFTKLPPTPPSPDIHLSDLELIHKERHSRTPVINQSFAGGPLKIHNTKYTKGIGTQAPSFLAYELRPEYKRFTAECGIDDLITDQNYGRERAKYPSVIFKVFIDGKLAAESPIMRNGQYPWSFNVPIPPGSRIINLVATNAGDGSFYDYADWVNAGFITK